MDSEIKFLTIYDYLRNNLSTRQLCKKYKELRDQRGWKSHYILKEYNLKVQHKGALFLCGKNEAKKAVKEIMETKDPDRIITKINLSVLDKYYEAIIIAISDEVVYYVLNGELRNSVMRLFKGRKKEIGFCRYDDCKNKNLDVAHRHDKHRKLLFLEAARKIKKPCFFSKSFKYPVRAIMQDFLMRHKDKAVFLLCAKHHREYDNPKTDKAKFIRKIKV